MFDAWIKIGIFAQWGKSAQERDLHLLGSKKPKMKPAQEKILSAIRDFADQAHNGQVRKYIPKRYIVHPFRVMSRCRRYTNEFVVLAAALLHDVLEDTPVSRDQLVGFLSSLTDASTAERIVNIVVELTDIYTVENFPYLSREQRKAMEAARLEHVSSEAQLIKYADIMDNTNEIVDHDPEFALVYLNECMQFLHKMIKGDFQLYTLTLKKVQDRLQFCRSLRAVNSTDVNTPVRYVEIISHKAV